MKIYIVNRKYVFKYKNSINNMNLSTFNLMQYIAQRNNLDLITNKLLMKKKIQMKKEEIENKISKEYYKNNYGINIDPLFFEKDGYVTLIIQNVDQLYKYDENIYTELCDILSRLDLSISPTLNSIEDTSIFDDNDELYNTFMQKKNTEIQNQNQNQNDDINLNMNFLISPELKNDHSSEIISNDEKNIYSMKKEILDFIFNEINTTEVCVLSEVKEKFKISNEKELINIIQEENSLFYDDEDKTIVRKMI